jgi:hypothetical protein
METLTAASIAILAATQFISGVIVAATGFGSAIMSQVCEV